MDGPESKRLIQSFIDDYRVDLTEIRDPIESFKTLNAFFYRHLKPESRPIFEGKGEKKVDIAVQPCDCRLHVFTNAQSATNIWIKGEEFSLENLLLSEPMTPHEKSAFAYQGGSFAICRLAPTDYHRFHAPFDCEVDRIITGEWTDLYSVKSVAVTSPINVFTMNKRTIVYLNSAVFGMVAYVIIGATEVGSINLSIKSQSQLRAGDEIGFFAYGGSTIIVVFPKSTIVFDTDLVDNSHQGIETLVRFGMSLGCRV